MTGKIFNYLSTLGTARSSDWAGFPAESEDSAYPTSFRKKRKYSVWMNDFYDFNIYSEHKFNNRN
ncbi:MAG: hypothetical protein U5L76_01510 [Patescibacteria group bacterium]|nr:hypothetical protein [Patescibacteria group bacterium]